MVLLCTFPHLSAYLRIFQDEFTWLIFRTWYMINTQYYAFNLKISFQEIKRIFCVLLYMALFENMGRHVFWVII